MKTEDRIVVAADVLAPGELILDEMTERGWSMRILSEKTGIAPYNLRYVIVNHGPLKEKLAKKLGEVFGTSTEFWLRLEAKYRFYKEQ